MKLPFYDGPYTIMPEAAVGERRRATPMLGEIRIPRKGVLILHCPACRSVQFSVCDLSGTAEAPTTSPIQCGSGRCKACGIWFQIADGRAVVVQAPVPPQHPIPEELREAGVRPAPKLPDTVK